MRKDRAPARTAVSVDAVAGSEHAFRGWDYAFVARIRFGGHAYGTTKGLEHRFALVVRVFALQVVDVQGRLGVIHKALEEFAGQVDVKVADTGAGEGHVVVQPRTTGEINHDPGEGFVERNVGMPIAAQAGLIAQCGGKGLAKRDADVFDRVVVVNMGIAVTVDVKVDQAVAGNLVEHVIQKWHAGVDALAAGAVEIDGYTYAGFVRVAGNVSGTHSKNSVIGGVEAVSGTGGVGVQPFTGGQRGGHGPQCLGAGFRDVDQA